MSGTRPQLLVNPVADSVSESVETKEEYNPQLTDAVQKLKKTMKSAPYRKKMGSSKTDYFNDLKIIFEINSIPLGLMVSLSELKTDEPEPRPYAFHFKVDDSGSMDYDSVLTRTEACAYMKTDDYIPKEKVTLSRWEEAEDRLHNTINFLSFIPTGKITFSFLNSPTVLTLERAGKNHLDFAIEAHCLVRTFFKGNKPNAGTPILENMVKMLSMSDEPTINILLTDGQPDGRAKEIEEIEQLLLKRTSPHFHPFVIWGLSNRHQDHQWMHKIEVAAQGKFFAAIPNYTFQQEEVTNNHGPYSYPRGYWLMANLVAVKDPHYIGALTQPIPLTKHAKDLLAGIVSSDSEYKTYFQNHPLATRLFQSEYSSFLKTKQASDIEGVKAFKLLLASGCGVTAATDKYNNACGTSKKNVFKENNGRREDSRKVVPKGPNYSYTR